jgi:UDP-N-acetylglucosamine transferase subunit ALG13
MDEFQARARNSSAIVSHAGIGSVLTAMEHGKPLVVMPRRADLREHRNDHQLATARWLEGKQGIWVVPSADALQGALQAALTGSPATTRISNPNREALIRTIAGFLAT